MINAIWLFLYLVLNADSGADNNEAALRVLSGWCEGVGSTNEFQRDL